MRLENDAVYKVYKRFDISKIADRLKELDENIWNLDVSRQAEGHGPHSKTNSIILNYCRGEPEFDKAMAALNEATEGWNPRVELENPSLFKPPWNHRYYDDFLVDVKNIEKRIVDEKLNEYTDVIVKELEQKFNGVAGLVLYAKLPAGTIISQHNDGGYYLEIIHRLHIPIITNDNVHFIINFDNFYGVTFNMKQGVLYEINNQQRHGVKNLSNTDRIHLIIDIIPRDKIPN